MTISLSISAMMCSMLRMIRHTVRLTEEERLGLEDLLKRKSLSALKAQRVRVLLLTDQGLSDSEVAEEAGVGTATVERLRRRAVMEGIAAALERKPQEGVSKAPTLDGRAQAHLTTLACSDPPEGFSRWTLAMLADKMVELQVVEKVSRTTICRSLKKTKSSRGR